MPASVPGQMPYAASPFASDFDAAQNAALRKRRLAEMLQQQVFAPDNTGLSTPGARMSWTVPLSKMMQGGMSAYLGDQADKGDAAATAARQSALEDLLKNAPQGTPAQPAIPGTPDTPAQPATPGAFGITPDQGVSPLATSLAAPPPPGGPPEATGGGVALAQKLLAAGAPPAATPPPTSPLLVPQRGATNAIPGTPGTPAVPAAPPTPQEMAAYGAKFLPLGPAAAKVGEQFTDAAVKQMLPKPPPSLMPVGGDLYDPVKDKWITGPSTQARIDETREARMTRDQDRANALKAKVDSDKATLEEKATYHNLMAGLMQDRIEMQRDRAGGASAFGAPEGSSVRGNDVLRGKDGVPHEVINGVPSKDPYAGPITPKSDQSKGVAIASKGEQGIKDMQASLKSIEDDPSLFGTRANLGALTPNAFGISQKVGGLSDTQLQKQANIASMTADTTHSLYGSAFSAGEQSRAKKFLIESTDSASQAKAKLAGRIQLEQDHYNSLPASVKAAAAQRSGGAAPSADGWTVTVKQ